MKAALYTMAETRTYVTFSSSGFNATEEKEYFINPNNFGDDLAKYLLQGLQAQSVEVDSELGQEDFGWYFTFRCNGQSYDFIMGHRDGEGEEWLGWLERSAGFLPSLLGARKKAIRPEAAQSIQNVLTSSLRIQNVRWHLAKDFDAGNEEVATTEPTPV